MMSAIVFFIVLLSRAQRAMRYRLRIVSVTAVAALLLIGQGAAGESFAGQSPAAPMTVAFSTLAGDDAPLADYVGDGRWTLVMIWSVTCTICINETPLISDFHDAHKDNDVHVVGLSLDGNGERQAVRTFRQNYDMRFPSLIGDVMTVATVYQNLTQEGFRGTPTFLLFDPTGELRGVNPGRLRPQAIESFIADNGVPKPAN